MLLAPLSHVLSDKHSNLQQTVRESHGDPGFNLPVFLRMLLWTRPPLLQRNVRERPSVDCLGH